MELTYAETLQLNNSREHLRVTVRNLQRANEELSKALALAQETKADLQALLAQKNQVAGEITAIALHHAQRETQVTLRENYISEKELEIQNKIAVANDTLDTLYEKIDDAEIDFSIDRSRYTKQKDSLNGEIFALEDELEILTNEINESKNIADQRSREVSELENERARLLDGLEDTRKTHEDFKRKAAQEKEEIEKDIEASREKVAMPMTMLGERQELLTKKEKDIDILSKRIRKQQLTINPTQPVSLELQ